MASTQYISHPKNIDELFEYCKHWIENNDEDNRDENWGILRFKLEEKELEVKEAIINEKFKMLQERQMKFNLQEREGKTNQKSPDGGGAAGGFGGGKKKKEITSS